MNFIAEILVKISNMYLFILGIAVAAPLQSHTVHEQHFGCWVTQSTQCR